MFWDASYTPSPKIEALLNRENVTLSELIDDEEIISECKSQNSKLVQFLNRPDILEELITLITTVPPPNAVDTLRFKHSNVACEILTSDLQSINRSIVSEEKVLQTLYAFLEQDAPLNPLLLSFFSKVFGMLWTQKQKQDWFTYQFVCVTVLEFLKSRGNFLDSVLRHVYSPVILDLVYHMVTHIEGPDIRKTLYEWLMEQQLVERLIGLLGEASSEEAADKHLNVAQFLVEYLSMGRTKRQSEKQEGVTADPILDLLEDRTTMQLLLDKMVADESTENSSSSAIVAGTRIILALFDDNLINDNTDDPALQFLVNSEKDHHGKVVSNLIEVIRGYVNKFHELLLIEPTPIVPTTIEVDSGISNETIVLSAAELTPEKDEAPVIGKEKAPEETCNEAKGEESATSDQVEVEKEKEVPKVDKQSSSMEEEADAEDSTSSTEVDRQSPGKESAESSPEQRRAETSVVEQKVPRRNNSARGPAFGNTRLQICCLFTVLLETENRDIINAICASNFFKTLLNLFKQYCWNNFLHSQVKKCLTYAIGAFDEVRDESATSPVQLEVSDLQRHLIVDCRLAPMLLECWQANEVEQVERNGVRLGYMGHLIGILEVLATNCKVSEKLRALVEESLLAREEGADESSELCSPAELWARLTGEGGELETELSNQNRFLADCNPCKMNECEPKDFFIEATDTYQDLESTALSENLDNFLSRYISSDLNSHFFNTMNGWSEDDNLDEFEGLADKNWSKFDGDDGGETSGNPLAFASPWENDEESQSPERKGAAEGVAGATAFAAAGVATAVAGLPVLDSGWANFSSANFADFDTHFNEFAIGTFDGNESPGATTANKTFDVVDESVDTGAEGDVKSTSLAEEALTIAVEDSNSDANTKKSEIDAREEVGGVVKEGSPKSPEKEVTTVPGGEIRGAPVVVPTEANPTVDVAAAETASSTTVSCEKVAQELAEKMESCSLEDTQQQQSETVVQEVVSTADMSDSPTAETATDSVTEQS